MDAAGELPEEIVNCLETLDLSCRLNLPRAQTGDRRRSSVSNPNTEPAVGVAPTTPPILLLLPGLPASPRACSAGMDRSRIFCRGKRTRSICVRRSLLPALRPGVQSPAPRHFHRRSTWARRSTFPSRRMSEIPGVGRLATAKRDYGPSSDAGAGTTIIDCRRKTLACRPPRLFRRRCFNTREVVAASARLAPNATIGCFYGATETQRAVGYYEIPEDFSARATMERERFR